MKEQKMNEKLVNTSNEQSLRNDNTTTIPVPANHHYLQAATSVNTRRTYQSAIRHFESWGGLLPATESIVIRYLLEHAEKLNPRTLSLRLTALRQWHRFQKFPDPTDAVEVRKTLKGIEWIHGKPKRKAKAFRLEHLETMITFLSRSDDLKSIRDRALLLMGFFGSFRRSELTAVKVEHLAFEPEGVIITLPRSKTDQTGEGKFKALPYDEGLLCPVTALRQWLELSGIKDGSIFRGITRWNELKRDELNPASINFILKTVALKANLDFVPELSSHSLRRSFATSAYRAGASFESIKRQGGWEHDGTVREYIEEVQHFEDNAVAVLLAKAKQ